MTAPERDVAIIGMACIFSKAPNLRAFWENILAGVDAIGDPPETWGGDQAYDPSSTDSSRLYTKRGGYLGGVVEFDPLKFGVMPRSVDGGEPEHFVSLQLAHDALADAGYLERPFDRERVEVILGRGTYANRGFVTVLQHTFALDQLIRILSQLHPEHTPEELERLRQELRKSLPPFNAETAPSLPHSVMCGRIANRLDLMGPAYAIDAACASALIAMDLGMKDLRAGNCDLALVGGVQISTSYPIALLFSQLGALSRKGQLRPFHPDADGTLLGEGAGVLVLKRRSEAERDGDRIYAVVKGVGTSSDGRAVGLLAPRIEGEELAMRRAYEGTGLDPDSIGLVEAHGTGTPVGDETEIMALRRIFGDGGDGRDRCALGAVKSMIGHCIPAAGAAGLIKTALAIYHKIIPPTLHAENPNPKLDGTPFYLATEARPWIHGGPEPRRAGVSAFGFGGINGHAILEEHRPIGDGEQPGDGLRKVHQRWDAEVFLLVGEGAADLAERCEGVGRFLEHNPDASLVDLAHTLNAHAEESRGLRLAIVASGREDLARKLDFARRRLGEGPVERIRERGGVFFFSSPLSREGKLAFLFPGEGSQYAGMLADICLHFPAARAWFDLMDRTFRDHHRGFLPSQSIFPIPGVSDSESQRLWQMEGAIEAVFAADQAMHAVLTDLGLRPDAVVGHSTGEYSALLASGAARVENRDRLIHHILDGNRATERAQRAGLVPEGVLLAVGPADPELIHSLDDLVEGELYLAMDNCPHQVVLCGESRVIERAEGVLRERGAICQRLPFDRAYHTPLFASVCKELKGFYDQATFASPSVALYSCVTAEPMPDDPGQIQRLALEHWARPVRFRETVERMFEDGVRIFVEVGPGGNLTAFVSDTLRGRPHLAVSSNSRRRSGMTHLHHLIGALFAHGVRLSLGPLYRSRGASLLDLEDVLAGRKSARPPSTSMSLSLALPEFRLDPGSLPKPRTRETAATGPAAPLPAKEAVPQGVPTSPRGRVMSEYFRVMESFLEAQKEVVAGVLARGRSRAAEPPERAWPLSRAVTRPLEGGGLCVQCDLGVETEPFLLDHTLGGTVSTDPSLRALPVFPLAMSLEMMAQVARRVGMGGLPRALRAVRVHRWLAFEPSPVRVEIRAWPGAEEGEIETCLVVLPDSGGEVGERLTIEATVVLGERLPMAPAAAGFELRNSRKSRWAPDQLYAEGQIHGMFHGPCFQGVASVDRVGDDGIEATLRAPASDGLLRPPSRLLPLLQPLLLDAVSQLVGYWTAEILERDFVVFPMGFDRLEVFSPLLEAGGPVTGRARCRVIGAHRVRSDLEIVGGDGRAQLRVSGWEVKRVQLPERVYAFRLAPREVLISDPLPEKLLAAHGLHGCRLELPEGFLKAEEGIWLDSLAHLALSRRERESWREMGGEGRLRREWLLGRLVAKDALRSFFANGGGSRMFPADIEVSPGAELQVSAVEGRPLTPTAVPACCLTQHDGVAAAVVGRLKPGTGLGLDWMRLDASTTATTLTAAERELLRSVSKLGSQEWEARLECAKRAASRAVSKPGDNGSEPCSIREIDTSSEAVVLEVPSQVSAGGRTSAVVASTARDGEFVYAMALWEGKE